MRIRGKLIAYLLSVALMALVVFGSLVYSIAKQELTDSIFNHLDGVAAIQQRSIEGIIEQNHERLALVASRTQLRLSLEGFINAPDVAHQEKMNRILRDAHASISDFRKLFIQTLDGRIVASTEASLIGKLDPDAESFTRGLGGSHVDLFDRNEQGEMVVYLAAPLYLDSRLLGVLVIESSVDNITDSTTDYHGLGETGETLLVRRQSGGDVVFITPARFDKQAALTRTVSRDEPRSPFTMALLEKEQLITDAIDYNGQVVTAVTRYIDNVDMGLVVLIRNTEAFAHIYKLRTYFLMIAGLLSLVIVAASLSLARSITQPIARLTKAATRISGGNLMERADVRTRDEIGVLARAFNRMTEELVDDINERRVAEEKFHALLQSGPDAIIITDSTGKIDMANNQAGELFGYDSKELLGESIEILVPDRYRQQHENMRETYVARPLFRPMSEAPDIYASRKDGTEFPAEISLAPIETKDGLLVACAIRDITERKQTEARLLRQANFDELTGLPNRALVSDRLRHALTGARRKGHAVGVMFLDLDHFKNINDTLGHAFGDKLLTAVAGRLTGCVREDDTVARLGGDEFLIVLPDLQGLVSTEVVASKILEAIGRPFVLDKRELFVSASIGITGFPGDSDDVDILLRNADAAMYRAKDAGRNTYRFFTSEMNAQLLQRMEMELHLRRAIENDEISIYFQPQIDIRNNTLVGAEALLRWNNPVLGKIYPDDFIPLAEETGLINPLGEWVLKHACMSARLWQGKSARPVRLAVNISPVQFRSGDLVEIVTQAIEASGLPPELLELEITERVLVEHNPNTSRILSDLKRLGVRLTLDDFGKGYSSLSYLKRFPFDVLKIDRAFVSEVTVNAEDAALCRAIIVMANSLSLDVVGEGVETKEQLEFLSTHGADSAQGFFFSKPLPAAQFDEYMRDMDGAKGRPAGKSGL